LIADIRDSELDVLPQHALKILTLSVHQIVDNENVEAPSRQLPNCLRADETGAAGYQNSLLWQLNHSAEKIGKMGIMILPNGVTVPDD
jgi:hypothetical protein